MSRAAPRYRRNNNNLPAPLANIFKVTVNMTCDIQVIQNQFFYQDDGSKVNYSDLSVIQLAWLATIAPDIQAAVSSDVLLTSIKVENLSIPAMVPYFKFYTGAWGTAPAGHEPSYVSVCVHRTTAYRTACGRGRVYLPGVPTAWRAGNNVAAGAADTAYKAAAIACWAAFTAGGVILTAGLYSKGSRTHKVAGYAPLVNAAYDSDLATCRHRKIGRGK